MEFFLRGRSIPTDGSGHLLITDISLHNGQITTRDEEPIICRSCRNVKELRSSSTFDVWYLDPLAQTLSLERGLVKEVMTEDGL